MKKVSTARKAIDWVVGILLLLIGVAGGFIPILQGWVFILAGLAVLSSHSKWARAIYERVKGAGRKVRDKIKHHREEHASGKHRRPDSDVD